MMFVWLWLACGESEPTGSTQPQSLTTEEVQDKTVRMLDNGVPRTGLVPKMHHEDERLLEVERLFQDDKGMHTAELLLKTIKEEPDFVAPHSLLSAVLIQLGDVTQATIAAEKVVELAPSALESL